MEHEPGQPWQPWPPWSPGQPWQPSHPWHHHGPYHSDAIGSAFGSAFGVVGPALLVVLTALLVAATVWSLRHGLLPADPRPEPGRERWNDAVAGHHAVARAYAAFECDPVAVLRLPALADVRLAPTARFVDAFAEAGALLTERYPGPEMAARLVAAVEAEERAWAAAWAAAERFRDARFDPAERVLLDQARTLLDVVASSAFAPERHAALRTALRRLADLEKRTGWRLPAPAVLAVEHRARGALAAAPQHG